MEKIKARTGIYHEHQQGALCAQHALNNLLQSQMFLADSLADIARQLDLEENSVLAHTSFQSENMDDTGFFNIQVLQLALKVFDIVLVPYASQELIAKQARNNPECIQAYICNLGLHWFTIRRFGRQYFNLNSFYYVPEFISNAILPEYLNFIQENGYSVFIVDGTLPDCLADQQLTANPIGRAEYELLIKDLPKFIMDDKIIGNSKDRHNHGNPVVKLPKDLYDKFKKNPNDPHIREMIYAQVPKDMIDEEIPEHAGCSNKHHHHPRRRLMITVAPEDITNEQMIGHCNCPHHRRQRQLLTEHSTQHRTDDPLSDNANELRHESQIITQNLTQYMTDDPLSDNPNESHHGPQIITQHLTQYIIKKTNPDNPNEPPQEQVIASRQMLLISRSSQRNDILSDNHGIQRMTKTSVGYENDEDDLLQHVMAQSLLSASEIDENLNIPLLEKHTEKLNQELLDRAIAASLITNNSTKKQSKETPELIPITTINSSPTPTMHSEPITIKTPPSSTTSHSPPPMTIFPPPATDKYSPPVTTTFPPPATNKYSPPPTTILPPPATEKYSPPLTVTEPASPKLRQRRLQFYGNRDRSIISQQSNSND